NLPAMKNILALLYLPALVCLISACQDEDKIRIPEATTGVNMRLVVDPAHPRINYETVATDYFALDAYSENQDLSLVEFFATYKDRTETIATYTQADFADGQVRIEL